MNKTEFQQSIQAGLGRGILYARENDVREFHDVILDACLHCYSADAQTEGTRASYMYELVNLLPDGQLYCDEILKSLSQGGDSWDAVQRFNFAACMAFGGDERAKQILYETFDPGPRMGEAIAINFLQLDGVNGFVFAAAKIGALLTSKPEQVDEGWLWSRVVAVFGQTAATAALSEAAIADASVDAYRRRVLSLDVSPSSKTGNWEQIGTVGYDELAPKLLSLPAFLIRGWGLQASAEEIARAANGLFASSLPKEQVQHLRIFSGRAFPFGLGPVLELVSSPDERLSLAAAIALTQVQHPAVRDLAFQSIQNGMTARRVAVAMLDRNWKPGDNEIALHWFQSETDREMRHSMELHLLHLWEHHPEPKSEPRMLESLYKDGPCSSCRYRVIQRFIELDLFSDSMKAECAYDADEDIRMLAKTE